MSRGRVIFFLLSLLLLSACSVVSGSGKGSIRFEEIFEERRNNESRIINTKELDVDGDGEDEWVVSYEFDPYLEDDGWKNAPIHSVVYDALPCDPPILHTWRLPFPDNDYVGEGGEVEAFMANWLNSSDPREAEEELILHGPGPSNTLSIFRFHNYQDGFPCRLLDENQQGFSLMGFFRVNGVIDWNVQENDDNSVTTVITTYQRTAYERSQLAIKSVYVPRSTATGETFLGADGRPIPPQEQSVAFMFGTPAIPADSPYPEKAVAAFYLAMGIQGDNERAQALLTEELAGAYYARPWGLDLPPDQLSRVLIYSISYTPDREEELTRLERTVKVTVVPVNLQNQRLPPRELTWRLIGIVEDDPEDCEWRLAELIGVQETPVTPGLGHMLPGSLFEKEVAVVP